MTDPSMRDGRYRKLYTRTWDNRRFQALTHRQGYVFVYLLTGPQTNRIGFYRLRLVNAAHDCNMTPDELLADLKVICHEFGWRYDETNDVMLLTSWWEYNAPRSADTMKGFLSDVVALPAETPLWQLFRSNVQWMPATVRDTFNSLVLAYDNLFVGRTPSSGGSPTGSPPPSTGGSRGPTALQEQDQEQEQEKKNVRFAVDSQPLAVAAQRRTEEKSSAVKDVKKRVPRPPAPEFPPTGDDVALTKEVHWFIAKFCELFKAQRGGATYVVTGRDAGLVKHMLGALGPLRLFQLARLMFLVQDDDFIVNSARDITILNAKVNWLEARLAETEARHAHRG